MYTSLCADVYDLPPLYGYHNSVSSSLVFKIQTGLRWWTSSLTNCLSGGLGYTMVV